MDPHMPYCLMIRDTRKFAHGGFPTSLQLCTSDSAWRLRPSSLDGMKIRVSWKEVTSDETLVHHYDPKKLQSMEWTHPSSVEWHDFAPGPTLTFDLDLVSTLRM